MTSGGYFFLGYNLTKGSINFSFALIASKFQLNILSQGESQFISINMMSIIVLLLLEKALKNINEQSALKANYEHNMNEWMESKPDLTEDVK